MPKKKSQKKIINADFTINDCANAAKPVSRVKKAIPESAAELTWDEVQDEDFDIVEEVNSDGTKNFVYKKKRNNSKSDPQMQNDPGVVYPEIVWYLISQYIKPEDVGSFAGINKATYAITKRESFWRSFYKRYCQNSLKLPKKLRLENNYKLYGLRQRVIRALFHTYKVFFVRVMRQAVHDSQPHLLVKRRCVNVWYSKGPSYWSIYFKLKKSQPQRRKETEGVSFVDELGRIDANPEEDTKVLQVTCQSFYKVPPLMGMTLSSVRVFLSEGFRHRLLHLGFNASPHGTSRNHIADFSVVLESVVSYNVYDWWHPRYPHFDNVLPSYGIDEERLPVLRRDFFATNEGEL